MGEEDRKHPFVHEAFYTIIAWAFMNDKSPSYLPPDLWHVSCAQSLAKEGVREVHEDLVAFVAVCVCIIYYLRPH